MARIMAGETMDKALNGTNGGWLSAAAPQLARGSFFLYLFFTVFGTSLPFQDIPSELQDMAISNPINQYVYLALYLASFLALLAKKPGILQLIRKEKFLTLFLFWSLVSIFWSDFGFISFKRWVQSLGMAIIFSAALLHLETGRKVLGYLKAVFFVYLPLSCLAVLLVPGATESEATAWRGLTSQKNNLGQVSLASLIVWTLSVREDVSWNKLASCLFWCLSLALLIGSRSMTSLLAGGILLFFAAFSYAEKTFLRPVAGRLLSSLIVGAFFLSLFVILSPETTLPDLVIEWVGKDMTFTSRVDIWTNVFADAKRHLFLGCGFGGYWVPENPSLELLYNDLHFFINHSHMGYLDILNETGVVGLAIVALMVIHYMKEIMKQEEAEPWKWFVFAALIVNLQESTLFRWQSVNGDLLVLSYLVMFAGAVRRSPSLEDT